MGELLFNASDMEENKETMYKMWKIRTRKLKEQNLSGVIKNTHTRSQDPAH